MKDFFRKHGGKILSVLGVLLMIVWLRPPGKDTGTGDENSVRGTLAGRTIHNADLARAATDLAIINRVMAHLGQRFRTSRDPADQEAGERLARLTSQVEHSNQPDLYLYLMLVQAQRLGVAATAQDVSQYAAVANISDDEIKTLSEAGRPVFNRAMFDQTLADLLAVREVNELTYRALYPTRPELEHLADDTESTLQLQYVILDANQAVPATEPAAATAPASDQPTEPDITAQFDAYKDRLPLELESPAVQANPPTRAGHQYPFGYKYPDRVKVEYLVLDRQAVKAKFGPTVDDSVNAEAVYHEIESQFRANPAWLSLPWRQCLSALHGAPLSAKSANSKFSQIWGETLTALSQRFLKQDLPRDQNPLVTASADAAAPPAFKPFKDLRPLLTDVQVDTRVSSKLKQIVDEITTETNKPFRSIDAEGLKSRAKEGNTADKYPLASYDAVAAQIENKADFRGYRPKYVGAAGWLNEKELAGREGIGEAAQVNSQGTALKTFPELALNVRELNNDPKRDALYRTLQTEADGPTLTDSKGNQYIYRVIATDKSKVPPNLTDDDNQAVRARVVLDLRRLAAYQRFQNEARDLVAQAVQRSLTIVALERHLPLETTDPISRLRAGGYRFEQRPEGYAVVMVPSAPSPLPNVGPLPKVTDRAFDLARQRYAAEAPVPATAPATATSPAAPASASRPAAVPTYALDFVPIDWRLQVFVFQVNNYSPIPANLLSLQSRANRVIDLAQREDRVALDAKWNSLESLAKRMDFVPDKAFPLSMESNEGMGE